MDLDIRKSIINNLKNEDSNGIINSINSAITSKDELILPGLGVLLELFWNELSNEEQNDIANIILKKMNK